MSNQISEANWLLPFFILFVKALPLVLALWIAWRVAGRKQSGRRPASRQFSASPRSLFPPEGAIVEEQRRRGR